MSWISRLKSAFNPRRLDEELTDEIRDHLDRRTADLSDDGLTPADARRRAAIAFGSIASLREESRELRMSTVIESAGQDLRYAWRGLVRNPAFAFTAVVSLGLAIGANTAIYAIVDAAILRPLPVPQPDRLVTFDTSQVDQPGAVGGSDVFSYPLYERLRDAAGDQARVALFDSPGRPEAEVGDGDAPYEEVTAQSVSADAFDVLGVPPALGQLLSADDDRIGSPRGVVVLSNAYWKRRFGGDPAILGKKLTVSNRAYSIVGVAHEGFQGVTPGSFVDVWMPINQTDPSIFTNPEFRSFHLIARLAPGATREQLVARLEPAFHAHQESRIGAGTTMPAAVQNELRAAALVVRSGANGVSNFRATFAGPLWILLGVSICILLIACANVASLLLARSSARSSEMALRVSLGARKIRLVRQLLTESLLISALASALGWAIARVAAPALVSVLSKSSDPIQLDLSLDTRVLVFSMAVCSLSALFFGLVPAWQGASARPIAALRQVSGQGGRLRLGRIFVSAQLAFAFCLVIGGIAFLFSLRNLVTVHTGFDARGVTVLRISTDTPDWNRQRAIADEMRVRATGLAEVQGAATAWTPMFSDVRRAQRIQLPGEPMSAREETFYRVSPGYFATLRTPLIAGRDFTSADNDDEPVATVVNRAFARRYFGDAPPIDREFIRDDGVRHRIVGLADDAYYDDLRGGIVPIAYMPMKPPRAFTLYVRSSLDAGTVSTMVDRQARSLGLGTRVRDVTTLDALVGNTILKEKLLAGLGGAFAFLGLVLAAIGLFGLMNYSVAKRTKEFGIRAALGARRLTLFTLVLKDLGAIVAAGLAGGLCGAILLIRIAQSQLFNVRLVDPLVIGTATAIFIATALLAAGLPAHRASTMDPVLALRRD